MSLIKRKKQLGVFTSPNCPAGSTSLCSLSFYLVNQASFRSERQDEHHKVLCSLHNALQVEIEVLERG